MTDAKQEKKLSYLKSLKSKHTDLDTRIQVCYAERIDDSHLVRMKQEKLRLKEEISKIEDELEV